MSSWKDRSSKKYVKNFGYFQAEKVIYLQGNY
jgi:hypothetical protein